MKKLLSIFLATVMIISSSISVFATSQTEQTYVDDNNRVTAQIVAAVVLSAGSYATNGIIQIAFTESVSAIVTNTLTKYTDINGGSTGATFKGKITQAKTRSSQYYNQTFYEGDAPQRYSSNASKAFMNTFTGGDYYHYSKMLSFSGY